MFTIWPRETLTKMAWSCIAAKRRASIRPRVRVVFGAAQTTTSARGSCSRKRSGPYSSSTRETIGGGSLAMPPRPKTRQVFLRSSMARGMARHSWPLSRRQTLRVRARISARAWPATSGPWMMRPLVKTICEPTNSGKMNCSPPAPVPWTQTRFFTSARSAGVKMCRGQPTRTSGMAPRIETSLSSATRKRASGKVRRISSTYSWGNPAERTSRMAGLSEFFTRTGPPWRRSSVHTIPQSSTASRESRRRRRCPGQPGPPDAGR